MAQIHPTAVVETGAELAEDVVVGPFCHVGPKAVIGAGTRLLSHVAIHGRTTLGEANTVWPFVTLGGTPQDLKYKGEDSQLFIGNHNEVRENVTIHKGTDNDNGITIVGDHNLLMVGCHVGHDCILHDHIIMANSVLLAGHVEVKSHAAIGGAAALHHFVTVGEYAYVGGMTRIVADVPPFMLVEGNPARIRNVNKIKLLRYQFPEDQIAVLVGAFRRLFRHAENDQLPGRSNAVLAELEAEHSANPHIRLLVDAVRRSGEGIHGRYRETLRQDNTFTNPVR
jgi:UDP-N-acetylglucosamine acyltransferase